MNFKMFAQRTSTQDALHFRSPYRAKPVARHIANKHSTSSHNLSSSIHRIMYVCLTMYFLGIDFDCFCWDTGVFLYSEMVNNCSAENSPDISWYNYLRKTATVFGRCTTQCWSNLYANAKPSLYSIVMRHIKHTRFVWHWICHFYIASHALSHYPLRTNQQTL